jgi:hypothetical protein
MNIRATEIRMPVATMSEIISELLYEAIRGYESILKWGVELQEELAHFWEELLIKSDSHEELQAKFQSMTADVPLAVEVSPVVEIAMAKKAFIEAGRPASD